MCLSDAVMKVAVSGFGKCTLESIDRRLKDHDKGGDVGVAREEGIKEKRSLTRSEFVNIFTGPPCTLEGCMLFTKNRMSRVRARAFAVVNLGAETFFLQRSL